VNLILLGLGILLSLSFGISDFLAKDATTKSGAYRTAVYVLALSGIGVLFPGLLLKSSPVSSLWSILVLVFVAVTTYLANVAIYNAYRKGMLSLTAPIVNSYPAIVVILSIFLIGASFSLGAIVSLVVVIVGVVLVSTSISDLKKRLIARGALAPGVGSAFVAMAFFAASWTAFGYASLTLGYFLPAVALRLGAAGVGFGLAPLLKEDVRPKFWGAFSRLIAMSALETLGVVVFSLAAIVSGSPDAVPIMTVFAAMGAAITVFLALFFLKERLEINHAVGVAMLIVGVAFLLYLTS
jgi:drug/metabolite transporter (DMT)-like permease